MLNNQQITEEIFLKIKICIETNENENTTAQHLSVQFSSVAQSCPTLCDPMDCSPPGSSVHGIFPGKSTYCIVVRKDAWNDFNFFEFIKARFMAQDVI